MSDSSHPGSDAPSARGSRFAAAGVLLAWILASMALLLLFRGLPLRVRGMMIVGSLLLMIAAITWMKLTRARK